MKYEKPDIEIMLFKWHDIVCTSPNITPDEDDDNDSDWT